MKKLLSSTLAVGILASMSFTPAFALDAGALPVQGGGVNSGIDKITQGSNGRGGNDMNVRLESGKGTVGKAYWDSFDVGKNSKVNFEFTGHNQTAFNKVTGSKVSEIMGMITQSSCAECGYDYAGTGKVILVNPNGILFGSNAFVDLNSFTATDMNATYNDATKQLELTSKDTRNNHGIVVSGGANIYGHKAVNLASDEQVILHRDSIIRTQIDNNGTSTDAQGVKQPAAYGKVKIATGDGINFYYYNNGAVKNYEVTKWNPADSDRKMVITLNGTIESGNIDVTNGSYSNGSELTATGATLKATKAVLGNDGNIFLVSGNKATINNTKIITENAAGAEGLPGGNIEIRSNGSNVKLGAGDDKNIIKAVGDVIIEAANGDVVVAGTEIETDKDLTITAGKTAALIADYGEGENTHNPAIPTSVKKAKNVNITAGEEAQVNATVNAENINVKGAKVRLHNSDLTASGLIKLEATSSTGKVYTTGGYSNMNGSKVHIVSANDIDVKLNGIDNPEKGIVAEAENNVKIDTEGKLSISRLVSRHGNMSLVSDGLVAGKEFTDAYEDEDKIPEDAADDRSYIYVLEGNFSSVDRNGNENYDVTLSDTFTDETHTAQQRHHIQDKETGKQKLVLITKRPYTDPGTAIPPVMEPIPGPYQPGDQPDTPAGPSQPSDPAQPLQPSISVDDVQAQYLNKLPRQPEVFNNRTVVNNNRTALVDVFAAASQIEVDEDEE